MNMSKHKRATKLFETATVKEAVKQSFIKSNPAIMFHNPVMFTVELGTAVILFVTI